MDPWNGWTPPTRPSSGRPRASGPGTGAGSRCPASTCCAPATSATPSPATATRATPSAPSPTAWSASSCPAPRCTRAPAPSSWSTRRSPTPPAPATPEGWAYATLYPSLGLVREVADATGHPPGTPVFDRPLADDARSGRLVRAVHRAVEQGDALAADTLLRVLLARLLNLYGTTAPRAVPTSAGRGTAARARHLLAERLTDPPSLEELAQTLGSSPFAVLRAFKAAYGMPPHTWLTDARVRRARALLHSGATPAETATAVGFTDQPHLNRHFTRIVGVPRGRTAGPAGRSEALVARHASQRPVRGARPA